MTKDPDFRFKFEARLERLDTGLRHHVLPIPLDISESIHESNRKRLIVQVKGFQIRRALSGARKDGNYIIVGQDYMKEIDIQYGEKVAVTIIPDPDPDRIDLCPEFEELLCQDSLAREKWESLTIGQQRSMAIYLNQAKKSETRIKRSIEVSEKLKDGTLLSKN